MQHHNPGAGSTTPSHTWHNPAGWHLEAGISNGRHVLDRAVLMQPVVLVAAAESSKASVPLSTTSPTCCARALAISSARSRRLWAYAQNSEQVAQVADQCAMHKCLWDRMLRVLGSQYGLLSDLLCLFPATMYTSHLHTSPYPAISDSQILR